MLTELDEQKYIQTMQGGMKNVTDTAEQITDIWDCSDRCVGNYWIIED